VTVSNNWVYLNFLVFCLSLMKFAVRNPHIYQTNSSVHGMSTRLQNKLHVPSVRLYSMHRGVYYSTIKILSHLPQNIFKFHNSLHIFKILLRDHLVKMSFVSLRDFFLLIMLFS